MGLLWLLISIPYGYFKMKSKCLAFQFDGKVDSVWYDDKGKPTIKIRGNKYDLLVNFWNFNRQIESGDSLIKVKNSMIVTLVKKSGKIIVFKQDL